MWSRSRIGIAQAGSLGERIKRLQMAKKLLLGQLIAANMNDLKTFS